MRRCSIDEPKCSSGTSDSLVGSLLVDSLLGFRLRKGPRLSNVSRETFVSISHYIAIFVSRETLQGGRSCSQRPRCLSCLPWHSSAAALRLPFAAPLLFRLPFPVAPHPPFQLSFPVHLRFPPPVPTPPAPRPPGPPGPPRPPDPSLGPFPRLSFSPAPQRRLRTPPQRLPSGGGDRRRRCARCV